MTKVSKGIIVFLLVLLIAVPCFAGGGGAKAKRSQSAQSSQYEEDNAWTKLKTGLINLFTGILDVPREVKAVTDESDIVAGATYGLVRGVAMGLYRTVAGAFDTVTFPFPPYDQPLVEPDLEI